MRYNKIGIIANKEEGAIDKKIELINRYGFVDCDELAGIDSGIDLMVALGGDGLMLHSLHEYKYLKIPIYGVNFGTVGFLMNSLPDDLIDAIDNSKLEVLHPLKMTAIDVNGKKFEHLAINEVSLLRQSYQAANIRIEVNDKVRLERLVCDGVLVATPAGSTAYNSSVNGPIIPLKADVLTITPISPFRPKSWRGALLSDGVKVKFDIVDYKKRPVSATADYFEVRDVVSVEIGVDKDCSFDILFDSNHSLEERIIREQFL
jgi:NAD+ kinase